MSASFLFFSFLPVWGFPLAHAALVPLFLSILRGSGLLSIWLFGATFGALYFFWLKVFSPLAPLLLTAVHGLWIALGLWPALCARLLGVQSRFWILAVAAAGWVGAEALRSAGAYGYEWGVLGYTQYGSLNVSAFASIGGIWLVSFLVLISNGLLAMAWQNKDRRGVILAVVYGAGLWILSPAGRLSSDIGAARDFGLIQTHVSPYVNALDRENILRDQLAALAGEAARFRSKNLILPETLFSTEITGMRGFLTEEPRSLMSGFLRSESELRLLIGAIEKDEKGFYNAAILFDAQGQRLSSYRKRHLVPFGETIPGLEDVRWAQALGEKLGTPFFSAGDTCAPLMFGGVRAAVLICFEGTFSRLVAESARDADVIINISNDAWSESDFGHSQHLRFLRFRAIETGLPVIRVGNSGPTALFAPNGRLILDIPHSNPAALDLSIAGDEAP